MRILILTSCTGEKAVEHPDQLTLADFKKGAAHVAKRERALKDKLMRADQIYTGEQHVRLMGGIEAARAAGLEIDLWILSAGYGIIPGDRIVAPYETTFATMGAKELRTWADSLEIPKQLRGLIAKPYDYGLVLLGDNYLKACAIEADLRFAGPTLLFSGKGPIERLPRVSNLRTQILTIEDTRRFSCGLVGLKGEIASRLLKSLALEPKLLTSLTDPATDVLGPLSSPTDGTATIKPSKKQKIETGNKRQKPRANPQVDAVINIPQSWWEQTRQKKLRYFIPEWDDLVDPNYNFLTDTHSGGSSDWSNEVYAHQLYTEPNYDGILVSRAVAEKSRKKKERINALGVHRFLRVPRDFPVMGDCGAFDYIMEEKPPYSTEDVLDYYTRLDFDFGVSVDHLIVSETEHQKKFRYELTIHNAEEFLKQHRKAGLKWTPIGAVQGWDADSYAAAAEKYVKMGYRYLGLGGLVRAKNPEIVEILRKVGERIPKGIGIHLFGVARLNAIREMVDLGATSCDSASALRRAWLGAKDNYRTLSGDAFRAIRIPGVGKSFRSKRMISEGRVSLQAATALERRCLEATRAYDQKPEKLEGVLKLLESYDKLIDDDRKPMIDDYRRTLGAMPWKSCPCEICRRDGVETIIFRGNNRNRRRGFHNTFVFYRLLQRVLLGERIGASEDEDADVGKLQLEIPGLV